MLKNRYQIQKVIGQGSFSTVFKALDTLENKEVAIKFFSAETINKKQIEPLIETECQFLKQFNCDQIIKSLDFFEENKNKYLVLELSTGMNLGEYIAL